MAGLIRGSHQVDVALKKAVKRFEAAQKKVNSSAAKRMKMGQYEAATKWMEVGQTFEIFAKKIEVIQQEWRDLLASSQKSLEGVESRKTRAQKDGSPRTHPILPSEQRSEIARKAAHKAWETKRSAAGISPKKLYPTLLKSLVKRGDAASSDELLGDLHSYILSEFPDSELAVNVPFNFPPWQKMVRKSYKYLQNQGWIERRKDGQWKITEKGRSAATE